MDGSPTAGAPPLPPAPPLPAAGAGVAGVSAAAVAAAAGAPTLEIDAADVLKLIMQFLREHGLTRSVRAIQDESNVALNFVDDGDAFTSDIVHGRWESVLPQIASLSLPPATVMLIYEQVVRELLEARETDAARSLLRTSLPLLMLRADDPARYGRLEVLAARPAWDAAEAYPDGLGGKEGRRHEIAVAVAEHLVAVPPSRLVALLSQAMRWQTATGSLPLGATKYDIYRGAVPLRRDAEDRVVATRGGAIGFGASAYPACACYSRDGASIITGSADGLVEVYDADTLRLRGDLPYQARDEFMIHETAVLAACVGRDGDLLATGDKDGVVKVWRLSTGECVRRYPSAHAAASGGVSCMAFGADGSQLLTGGHDGLARVHGLRSGKTLREYRGHTAPVTAAVFTGDGSHVVTASLDGTVRVWESRGQECVAVIRPPQTVATADVPIVALAVLPRTADHLLVVPRGATGYVMTLRGTVLRSLTHGKKTGGFASLVASTANAAAMSSSAQHLTLAEAAAGTTAAGKAASGDGPKMAPASGGAVAGLSGHDFVACAPSPQGRYAYLLSEDRVVYVFSLATGRLEGTIEGVCDKDPLGVAHHPLRNQVATYGTDGKLRVWKP